MSQHRLEYIVIIGNNCINWELVQYFQVSEDYWFVRVYFTCGKVIIINADNIQEWTMISLVLRNSYQNFMEQMNG